jgi:hypothetical protein
VTNPLNQGAVTGSILPHVRWSDEGELSNDIKDLAGFLNVTHEQAGASTKLIYPMKSMT